MDMMALEEAVIVEAVHHIVINRRAHWWVKRAARYLMKIENGRARVLQRLNYVGLGAPPDALASRLVTLGSPSSSPYVVMLPQLIRSHL
jgi:hypothetical protein